MYLFFKFFPILEHLSLDDLENKITFVTILVFIAYIGIPLIKLLFGKKDDE